MGTSSVFTPSDVRYWPKADVDGQGFEH